MKSFPPVSPTIRGYEKYLRMSDPTASQIVKQMLFADNYALSQARAARVAEYLRSELGLNAVVHFAGYVEKEDWRDCYAGADLFTLASIPETQGLVVSEAMAAGVPVVAVGEMGIKDVMASGKGGLMTRLDEKEFGEAVFQMLTDKKLYEQKKAETLVEAEKWSSPSMAKRMIDTYEKLLQI